MGGASPPPTLKTKGRLGHLGGRPRDGCGQLKLMPSSNLIGSAHVACSARDCCGARGTRLRVAQRSAHRGGGCRGPYEHPAKKSLAQATQFVKKPSQLPHQKTDFGGFVASPRDVAISSMAFHDGRVTEDESCEPTRDARRSVEALPEREQARESGSTAKQWLGLCGDNGKNGGHGRGRVEGEVALDAYVREPGLGVELHRLFLRVAARRRRGYVSLVPDD